MTKDPMHSVRNDDTVSRSLLDPKDYTLALEIPQLNLLGNFPFNNREGRREESVNCMRLFSTQEAHRCHQQGRRKCIVRNVRRTKEGKKPDEYAGYISAKVSCISSKTYKTIVFDVINTPKHFNRAHCDIRMLNGDVSGLQTKDRNVARELLITCFDSGMVLKE